MRTANHHAINCHGIYHAKLRVLCVCALPPKFHISFGIYRTLQLLQKTAAAAAQWSLRASENARGNDPWEPSSDRCKANQFGARTSSPGVAGWGSHAYQVEPCQIENTLRTSLHPSGCGWLIWPSEIANIGTWRWIVLASGEHQSTNQNGAFFPILLGLSYAMKLGKSNLRYGLARADLPPGPELQTHPRHHPSQKTSFPKEFVTPSHAEAISENDLTAMARFICAGASWSGNMTNFWNALLLLQVSKRSRFHAATSFWRYRESCPKLAYVMNITDFSDHCFPFCESTCENQRPNILTE